MRLLELIDAVNLQFLVQGSRCPGREEQASGGTGRAQRTERVPVPGRMQGTGELASFS